MPLDRSLKRWEIALMAGVLCALLCGFWLGEEQTQLADRVIRFHVIANSDAPEDQALKLQVRDAVLFAKKQGAVTIAITDNAANPLACASDHVLLAPVQGVAVDYTHVATLAMLDLIVNSLAQKNPEIVAQSLEKESSRCDSRDLFCL